MGDVIDQIEARDALLFQEINRVGVGLAKHGDQDIAAVDFLALRRLRVNHARVAARGESLKSAAARGPMPAGSVSICPSKNSSSDFVEFFEIAAASEDRAFAVFVAQQSVTADAPG